MMSQATSSCTTAGGTDTCAVRAAEEPAVSDGVLCSAFCNEPCHVLNGNIFVECGGCEASMRCAPISHFAASRRVDACTYVWIVTIGMVLVALCNDRSVLRWLASDRSRLLGNTVEAAMRKTRAVGNAATALALLLVFLHRVRLSSVDCMLTRDVSSCPLHASDPIVEVAKRVLWSTACACCITRWVVGEATEHGQALAVAIVWLYMAHLYTVGHDTPQQSVLIWCVVAQSFCDEPRVCAGFVLALSVGYLGTALCKLWYTPEWLDGAVFGSSSGIGRVCSQHASRWLLSDVHPVLAGALSRAVVSVEFVAAFGGCHVVLAVFHTVALFVYPFPAVSIAMIAVHCQAASMQRSAWITAVLDAMRECAITFIEALDNLQTMLTVGGSELRWRRSAEALRSLWSWDALLIASMLLLVPARTVSCFARNNVDEHFAGLGHLTLRTWSPRMATGFETWPCGYEAFWHRRRAEAVFGDEGATWYAGNGVVPQTAAEAEAILYGDNTTVDGGSTQRAQRIVRMQESEYIDAVYTLPHVGHDWQLAMDLMTWHHDPLLFKTAPTIALAQFGALVCSCSHVRASRAEVINQTLHAMRMSADMLVQWVGLRRPFVVYSCVYLPGVCTPSGQ